MAAIDKIYINTFEQYKLFKEWCSKQPKLKDKYGTEVSLMYYIYDYDEWEGNDEHPIFNAPYYIDAYVIRNCPYDFIQKELMLNYGHKSQEWINEAYETVIKREDEGIESPYFNWLTKNDFKVIDGIITIPNKPKSDYELIKEGKMFTKPTIDYEYEVGKHFKCIKHPLYYYNKAFKCKYWFIDLTLPDYLGYAWYSSKYNTWDLMGEFVVGDKSSTCVKYKTIKAIKRAIRKWKLPIGTIVSCTGRYISDTYEFKITK